MTANDNGKLEFLEFCEIIAKNRKTLEEEKEELRNAFRMFDRDGNGHVDREELKKVSSRLLKVEIHYTFFLVASPQQVRNIKSTGNKSAQAKVRCVCCIVSFPKFHCNDLLRTCCGVVGRVANK